MDADAETDGDKGSSKYMFRFLKRKVTNMTECGECQGEMKSGWLLQSDLCARENSHFLLTSICTLTSNPTTIVPSPPPVPDQDWMADVEAQCVCCALV